MSTSPTFAPVPVPTLPSDSPPAGGRRHLRHSGSVRVALPPAEALALFTAAGERRWVPGWAPVDHHPPDGAPAAGAVFSTVGADGRAVHWIQVDWEPTAGRTRYARVTPGLRAGTVEVVCEPAPGNPASTVARVTYDLTALSPEGDRELTEWDESYFAGMLDEWERLLAAHLGQG